VTKIKICHLKPIHAKWRASRLIEQGSGSWCRELAGFEVALSFVIALKGQRQISPGQRTEKECWSYRSHYADYADHGRTRFVPVAR
jgi:hypothetical protein